MKQSNIGIKRKCACCREYFYINKNNVKEAIYYGKNTYHSSCFIDICQKRSKAASKNISEKWSKVLNNIDAIKNKSADHFNNMILKDDIFNFIRDTYDITVVPTVIWRKLDSIYEGTYKGMSCGIPPEHLLDMWTRKIDMLNSLANKNVTQGKKMSTEQRISYDLSVLINKYDSYLKWLEKQKILEAEKNTNQSTSIVGQIVDYVSLNNQLDDKRIDNRNISDLVDDIFG